MEESLVMVAPGAVSISSRCGLQALKKCYVQYWQLDKLWIAFISWKFQSFLDLLLGSWFQWIFQLREVFVSVRRMNFLAALCLFELIWEILLNLSPMFGFCYFCQLI